MVITASMVNELRGMTGAGMMDCKKALTEADGNMDKAIEILRERGVAKAAKKEGRIAAEGFIDSYVHGNGSFAALVEVNTETDFAAKNEELREFAHNIAMQVVASRPICVNIDEVPADRMLYVVSVESGLHGAAAIAYPDFHDKVSEKVSGNFYVIPSSVNEVLIISDKAADARGLNDMIREVNSTMVSPEERLSDQCLHYDAKARVFSIGTDHDDKMLQKQQKNLIQFI